MESRHHKELLEAFGGKQMCLEILLIKMLCFEEKLGAH